MFALDLCGLDESLLRNYERRGLQLDITSEFAAALVAGLLDSITDEHREPGMIAIYFRRGNPVHAGLLMPHGRVQSKWGMGHLWEHDLFELRTDYGEEVRFFRRQPRNEIVRRYTWHVKAIAGQSAAERAVFKIGKFLDVCWVKTRRILR
jgi:hypothetical protein